MPTADPTITKPSLTLFLILLALDGTAGHLLGRDSEVDELIF